MPDVSRKKAHQVAKGNRLPRKAKVSGALNALTQKIAAQIAKLQSKSGSKELAFRVFINGKKVTFGDEEAMPTGKAVPAPAKSLPKAFDPFETGRKAVALMQQAEGGAWIGTELEARFGLTPANLHKRRAEHRIVWWKDARNRFHYPKWQFNAAGALLPGVQELLQAFRSQDEWRVMRYFLGPRDQLANRTPLDLLRAGEVEKVLVHAKLHAEENTW
ncbi:MAG TPA: hypothetical protein VIT91_05445 [Chthoniobacterales bacterium]